MISRIKNYFSALFGDNKIRHTIDGVFSINNSTHKEYLTMVGEQNARSMRITLESQKQLDIAFSQAPTRVANAS